VLVSRPNVARRVRAGAPVFAALGDPTRLRIILKLAENPQSIAQLTIGERVTRQAITKHLEVLAGAGLVDDERDGRERIWRLVPEPLDEAKRCLELVSEQWDRALARLRDFVER
jgi:DNA-binding transcriptional ArsR family regulator